ncbi:putative inactive leucine-rich repeat receptor-like protein kinase imk2 [Ranunculus cassubicifolius]
MSKRQREFEVEADLLGNIRHPNLFSLRAYYLGPKGEKLLVFDYMPRGSLGAFLHARGPDTPIDWPTRMNIIMGVTRGLCYIHTNENLVHGNLTGGNILLDEQKNPKISDYGISRLMNTTGGCNMIMLELLTGKSPNEPTNGMDLPQWVASVVAEEYTNDVYDLELMRDATTGDELLNTLKLALHCCDPTPTARPDAQPVLEQLEQIRPELAAASASDDHESFKSIEQ